MAPGQENEGLPTGQGLCQSSRVGNPAGPCTRQIIRQPSQAFQNHDLQTFPNALETFKGIDGQANSLATAYQRTVILFSSG